MKPDFAQYTFFGKFLFGFYCSINFVLPSDFLTFDKQKCQFLIISLLVKVFLFLHYNNVERSCKIYSCPKCLMPSHMIRAFLRGFNVVDNHKPYLGFHIECPIFLTDFIQIWIFSADFHENLQYQFSRKSVQRESR
jgi:hypothetical protein